MAHPKNLDSSSKASVSMSSDKVIQIIECLAESKVPVRLQDLAASLNMNQPTLLRYLKSLQLNEYVYQEPDTLRYYLTWKICKVADAVRAHLGLRDIAAPFLQSLSKSLDSGACIVQEENGQAIYLDVVDIPHATLTTLKRIGKGAPMYSTGSGKLLLSSYPDYKLSAYMNQDFEPFTIYTITDKAVFGEDISRIRQQGFALDNEECELGVRCVSAPVFDYNNQLVAALSVFSTPEQFTNQRLKAEVLPLLFEATQTVSQRIGNSNARTYNPDSLDSSELYKDHTFFPSFRK